MELICSEHPEYNPTNPCEFYTGAVYTSYEHPFKGIQLIRELNDSNEIISICVNTEVNHNEVVFIDLKTTPKN